MQVQTILTFCKRVKLKKLFFSDLHVCQNVLICVAIDFDVADIPGRIWKWPSLGK